MCARGLKINGSAIHPTTVDAYLSGVFFNSLLGKIMGEYGHNTEHNRTEVRYLMCQCVLMDAFGHEFLPPKSIEFELKSKPYTLDWSSSNKTLGSIFLKYKAEILNPGVFTVSFKDICKGVENHIGSTNYQILKSMLSWPPSFIPNTSCDKGQHFLEIIKKIQIPYVPPPLKTPILSPILPPASPVSPISPPIISPVLSPISPLASPSTFPPPISPPASPPLPPSLAEQLLKDADKMSCYQLCCLTRAVFYRAWESMPFGYDPGTTKISVIKVEEVKKLLKQVLDKTSVTEKELEEIKRKTESYMIENCIYITRYDSELFPDFDNGEHNSTLVLFGRDLLLDPPPRFSVSSKDISTDLYESEYDQYMRYLWGDQPYIEAENVTNDELERYIDELEILVSWGRQLDEMDQKRIKQSIYEAKQSFKQGVKDATTIRNTLGAEINDILNKMLCLKIGTGSNTTTWTIKDNFLAFTGSDRIHVLLPPNSAPNWSNDEWSKWDNAR
jgi:hypothetical protein